MHDVVVTFTEVVGSVIDRVVVAVPRRGTTGTAVVTSNLSVADGWVRGAVRVVSCLVVAGHVPHVAIVVFELDVVAVGDEVVLA